MRIPSQVPVLPSAALVAALMAVTMNNRNGGCYGAILFPALLLNSLFLLYATHNYRQDHRKALAFSGSFLATMVVEGRIAVADAAVLRGIFPLCSDSRSRVRNLVAPLEAGDG